MRVLLNGVSTLHAKTGVGHTTANLHRALCDAATGDDVFWLYPGRTIARACGRFVGRPGGGTSGGGGSRLKAHAKEAAKAAYRLHLRAAARWGGFDLYHEPNFVPVRTHLPTVVTVHDLSVVLHPEWHPADRVAFHARHFEAGLRQAEHVVVVSESVRRELISHMGFPAARVTAVLNGIGDEYRPQLPEVVFALRARLGLPDRYFLAVGTIEPRKNLLTLLRAFCDLPAALRESCPLLLAGGWGWKSEPERAYFDSEAKAKGVRHLGYVADADLPALYAGAAALAYPSFYEGFGLPPVEMLATGGGVLASTAAAVREVVGGHARLIDPHDLAGWRDALGEVAADPAALDDTRRGGIAHSRRFTWSAAAARTLGVYRGVLGLASPGPVSLRPAA
ncbi:glycosyltransferase family 4 protein [Urbifossiella limnaea]|uniref:D-inositol 3-phosphate glycosyltransferase n=1 Tax=Urbifossiella limnaea TaxID=2528023 RepID=A0A517XVT9_9BACT|nr:glycosyltransferase family 1 protein [Urbifossiella limnaea]QDU21606.1 D-inositol 3-phosphate glycosyltransferase [Urbifossiella limnaea]